MDATPDNRSTKPWETSFQRSVMRFAQGSLVLNFTAMMFFTCVCGHLVAPGVLVFPTIAFILAWFAFFASVQRPAFSRLFLMFVVVHATTMLWTDVLDVLFYGHHPLYR